MAVRISQSVIEYVITNDAAPVRISQSVIEVVKSNASAPVRISQSVIEYVLSPTDIGIPIIDSTATLFPPEVALASGAQNVTLPFISSTAQLFAPTLFGDPQSVTLPFISSTAQLFAPGVATGTGLTLPFISSTALVHPPFLLTTTEQDIILSAITTTAQLYVMALIHEEITLGGAAFIGLTWVEFHHVDDTGEAHTYVWSQVDIPDPETYFFGFKEGRVITYSPIRRALSDYSGQLESVQFGFTISDTDHLNRAKLDLLTGVQYYLNRMVVIRMIDDASRRLFMTPRTIARGVVRGIKPVAPLQFEFRCEDYLSTQFGTLNLDKQIPLRTINRTDFTDCPSPVVGKGVPIIYGDVLEQISATSPPVLSGDPLRGAFYAGDLGYQLNSELYPRNLWVMGWGNRVSGAVINVPSPTAGPDPVTNVTALQDASFDGQMHQVDFPIHNIPDIEGGILYFQLVVVNSSGVEGDPHIFAPALTAVATELPGTVQPSTTYATITGTYKSVWVDWAWAADAGPGWSVRIYAGYDFYNVAGGGGWTQVKTVQWPFTRTEINRHPPFGVAPVLTPIPNVASGANVVTHVVTRFYAVSALMFDGETSMSTYAFGKSAPYRRPIRIEWKEVPGATQYFVYAKDRIQDPWNRRWVVPNSQQYFEDDLLDTTTTFIDVGDVGPSGPVPCMFVGYEADLFGALWHRYLVCGHAVREIPDIFVDGVKVDPQYYGLYACVPGQPGYSTFFPNTGFPQYRDINGRRYTIIYGRGDVSSEVAAGTKRLTANVRGIETAGDGTGSLIFDLFDQYLHACKNWFFQDYQSGAWLDTPNWDGDPNGDIIPKIDESSFGRARGVALQRFSTLYNYYGAVVIGANGERRALREYLRWFNISGDVDAGFNHRAQYMISMVNPDAEPIAEFSPVDGTILKESVQIENLGDRLENCIVYSYRRDWAKEQWDVSEAESRDAASITNYREERKSQHAELWCVRDPSTALNVVANRLARGSVIPNLVRFRSTLAGLTPDLGDVIVFTHFEGLGPSPTGWIERLLRVIRHITDPRSLSVTIEAIDMRDNQTTPEEPEEPSLLCISVYFYDFSQMPDGPLYPSTAPGGPNFAYPNYWQNPLYPFSSNYAPALPLWPNAIRMEETTVRDGRLTWVPESELPHEFGPAVGSRAVFGDPRFDGLFLLHPLFTCYNLDRSVYARARIDFDQFLYDEGYALFAPIFRIFGKTCQGAVVGIELCLQDTSWPAPGNLDFVIRHDFLTPPNPGDILAYSIDRDTLAGSTREILFRCKPATPIDPNDDQNYETNFDGWIRLYIDNVLVYEELNSNWLFQGFGLDAMNEAYQVGGIGLGDIGFVGSYHNMDFGYCDGSAELLPLPPTGEGGPVPPLGGLLMALISSTVQMNVPQVTFEGTAAITLPFRSATSIARQPSVANAGGGGGGGGGGGEDLIFDMYQSGSYPTYAFGSSPVGGPFEGEYYSVARLAGQAPSGQDAIRFTGIPTTDVIGDIGNADWGVAADWPAFTQGDSVFLRWRVRFNSPLVWKRAQDEGRGHWKSSIFGDTCESAPHQPTRCISFDRRGGEDPVDEALIFAVQNIGCAGGIDCATSPRPAHILDQWTHIQIEYQSSTLPTANNAVIRIWINNNVYGSPTGISPDGFPLKVDGWSPANGCGNSGIRWGPGTFEPINEDASLIVDWADFQIGLTFDPNWAL